MKKLLLRSNLLLLIAIMLTQLVNGQTFTEHASLTGVTNSYAAWGDYDNDGDLDILITGSNTSKIYRNDAGVFTDIAAGLQGVQYGSADWGDYDNDGDLDILITGNGYAIIYRNNAGNFTDLAAGLPGVSFSSAVWGDFDNDGDLDIILTGQTSAGDRISRIYRDDNGVFTDIQAGLTGVYYGAVAWGDYDKDHDLDLIITGSTATNQRISVIYRNDNGIFNNSNSGIFGTYNNSLAWGDYDNDGDLDLLVAGASYVTKLYRNDNGSFNEVITGLPGTMYSSVAWGDCDNDGDLDILMAGSSRDGIITKVFLNDAGTFTVSGAELTGIYRGSARWGDYDKDGDLDILITGSNISKIYNNNSATANSVPSAPSGLTATPTGKGMVLSWNKATDTQTSQEGLSYNLYIGTVSGAVNKRSPMAVVPGGFLKVVRKGEIQTNSWTIRRLPAATYYWSVQAVDNGLAGSPFATQTTFTVPFFSSTAPASDQIVAVNQAITTVTVTESSTPTSRQWKYSTVSGGPYNQLISGATGTTCSASFPVSGTYYLICESLKGGIAYISNEVKITVSDFSLQTGISLPPVSSGTVKWGDYDADGDMDLFISGYNDGVGDISRIYQNNSGTFTDINAGLSGVSGSSADWGDFDNDGDLDLVVAGNYSSVIYRNDEGIFNPHPAGPEGLAGVSQSSVSWGDYDNDGDLDLILSGNTINGYNVTKLYRNKSGIFTDTDMNFPGVQNGYLSWGDYDNDGDLDLLITGYTSSGNISKIFRNENGLFTDISAGFTGVLYGSAGWGDYDDDGDLDLFTAGASQAFLYNNNNGYFAQVLSIIPGVTYNSSEWGDYDNDGDLDLLITGSGTTGVISRIYRNENGVFGETASGLPAVSYGSAAWGDYDNDGDLDLVITGKSSSGDVSLIYKNMASSPNTLPSAPSGLTASVEPNKMIFSWTESSDAETPAAGLSYNLYIGTSAGSEDKKSPMASIPGGHRRIVKRGSQGNSWYIDDFPSGTYYWSVQAIDHLFAGSGFAAEGSFAITYSTEVSPEEDQTLVINQNGTTLTVSETTAADSRQWKYSTTAGGPYNNLISGATGTSCIPIFSDWGTYFIVCESVKDAKVYTSNEVRINLPVFTPVSTPDIYGTRYGSVKWGDFDNDSDLDVVTGGLGLTRIYHNDGGTFINTGISLPNSTYTSANWGDYDNDGDLDLVVVGANSGVYRNDGLLSFVNTGNWLPTMAYPSSDLGDYDNDGDLDILIAGGGYTWIFRNDNGTFTDAVAGLSGIDYGSAAFGDYDNDGDLDILITGIGLSDYITRIYRNDKGSFTGIITNIPGVYYSSAAWGDYDNDGDLDILISGYSSGEMITKIYRNDNGIFPDIGAGLPGLRYSSVSWHDYDNDGDLDVFISGNTSTSGVYISEIYRNDNGTFVSLNSNLTGVVYGSHAWGDYDNDGDIDLIITGQSSAAGNISILYKNNITTPNTAPSVPSSLQSSISSNKVDLTWTRSTDTKTPQNGISYNVYVGTAPGFIDEKSPMAELSTGYRKIPLKGNQINSFTVRNLTAGTYYWSVQAIDNTFTGSAFAAEASFIVPFSSSVAPAGEQVLNLNQNGTLLTVTESSVPASHQWKYSTISGGPYNQVIAGATSTTYTPNFSSFGTFYVICESVYNLVSYTSNEVKIRVPVFTEQPVTGLPGAYLCSAEWGDFNNDGDADIVITNSDVGSAVFVNNGGVFSDIGEEFLPQNYSTAKWTDYDNDNDLDLFMSGYTTSGAVSVIYRNDAGTFTDIKAGLPGIQEGSADWADFDNDGDQDILISGINLTKLFRNDDGSFHNTGMIFPGLTVCDVAWADYDRDGDPDILLTGSAGTNPVSWIYRNENGNFVDTEAGLTGVSKSSVAWGDYDNDGDPDILLSGNSAAGPVTIIYRNNGGIFTDIGAGLQGVYYSSVRWGDFDNDGDLDILLSGETGAGETSRVYRNDGGVFVDLKEGLEGVQTGAAVWGDYDNDGDLDIFLAGASSYTTISKIYSNNTSVANVPPVSPSNLTSTAGANSVTLSWNKSSDSTTPQNGLTYNVYIGSSAGGTDIMAPEAQVSGGLRRVVESGRNLNSMVIKSLPAGTYFWSVQAIDNSFAGSAFAAEASFTVSYSTSVSPEGNQSLAINEEGTDLTVTESSPSDSRQWKYSTTTGGPYDNVITGATGITYTPVFPAWGTYYVVCESTKDAVVYRSNEVCISLPVFIEQTGIDLFDVRTGTARWGDYDNDGDLDILLVGGNIEVNVTKIYRNDNGVFSDINAPLTGLYQATASWGDYDADGDLDLFVSGYISSQNYTSKIYRNDSGTFIDIAAGLTGVNMASGTWIDYDNDGDLDLLISGMSSSGGVYISTLYRNNNGVFNDAGAALPGVYMGSVAAGDYDNDGDQDLVLSGRLFNGTLISRIYRNDNGSFIDINAGIQGVSSGSAVWGDYDNDGDLDLLITGNSDVSASAVTLVYQNSSGIFAEISTGLPGLIGSSAAWGDYDNDGDLDLLLSGSGTEGYLSRVYRNDSGVFTDINAVITGMYTGSVAWGDYNNDGGLDILLTGYTGENYTKIYKNTTSTANAIPSAPANLKVTAVSVSEAIMSWDKVTDTETPQIALTYNLRLGDSPGSANKVSPMASHTSGYRRIPARGNAEFRNTGYNIKTLSPGTYYWSVQAIDQAYAGGAWATEASFTLLAGPAATAATNVLQISFMANWGSVPLATGYKLDVATDALFTTFLDGFEAKDVGNVLSTQVTGLNASTTYYYRIRAYQAGGTSLIYSNTVTVITPVEVPVPTANPATSITQTGFTANWTTVASAVSYSLDVATDIAFTTFVAGYNNKNVGSVITSDVTGLTTNTTYYYRVRANGAVGTSVNSNTITVNTLPNPPSAPASIAAENISSTGFILKWRTSPTASTYYLDISTVNDFASFITGYNNLNNGSDTSKTVTGLSPATTYYFRARAGNTGGISSSSATGNATTLPEIPSAPVSSAAGSIGQVVFTACWSASSGATGYRLDVSTDVSFTTLIPGFDNLDAGNVTSYDVSGLTAKTNYYYRVRAYNVSGTSGNSNSITVTTLPNPPAAPSGLAASSCNNLVTLSWTANTETDFQKYIIYGGITANPTNRIDSTQSISTVIKTISGLTSGQTYYFRITAVISPGVASQYSTSVSVLVKKGVVPKIKSKFSGAVLVCYNPGDSIAAWQWYRGAAAISGATKQYYVTAGAKESFSVLTTDKNGCQNSSNIINLTGTKSVSVWPNPAEDNFTLKFSSGYTGRTMIMLFNSSGVKVSEYQTDKPDEELECIVPVGHLPDGLYTVEIVIDGEIVEYSRVMVIN